MGEESLRELLTRVHERLSRAASVDAPSRELLSTVMHDIDRALRGDVPSVADVKAVTAPRLEALAVRFEAEHPAIAQLLRQIADVLGQAGI